MVLKCYIASLRLTRPLLHSRELTKHWARPSLLEGYTVGTLTAHLVLTVARVVDVVGAMANDSGPSEPELGVLERSASELMIAARLKDRSDLYVGAHLAVRRSAGEIAAEGPRRVASLFDTALTALLDAEVGLPEDRMVRVPMPARMPVGDWLSTRLVEVVVHTEDLTESLGLPPVTFGDDIMSRVIDVLVTATRARVGDRAVVIGLARAERAAPDVLRAL
jgi:uncharacterized protein (TIGR03083 family)